MLTLTALETLVCLKVFNAFFIVSICGTYVASPNPPTRISLSSSSARFATSLPTVQQTNFLVLRGFAYSVPSTSSLRTRSANCLISAPRKVPTSVYPTTLEKNLLTFGIASPTTELTLMITSTPLKSIIRPYAISTVSCVTQSSQEIVTTSLTPRSYFSCIVLSRVRKLMPHLSSWPIFTPSAPEAANLSILEGLSLPWLWH